MRLSFVGTAGIVATGFEVFGVFPDFEDREEFCIAQVNKIMAKAESLDCTTGQVNLIFGFVTPAGFAFVCQGSRDSLVNTIGELTREFVADSP